MAQPPAEPALHLDWDRAVADLAGRGWTLLEDAVRSRQIDLLGAPDDSRWRLLEDEGVARQHGFGAYLAFETAPPAVRQVGSAIILGLSKAAQRLGLPDPSDFNEATWTRYPQQDGRITKHRDFPEYGGVIAVFTLRGSAIFRVFESDAEVVEWPTIPGHVVVLRGAGWPSGAHRCPPHAVDAPPEGERVIMTLRSNSNGPGSGHNSDVGQTSHTPSHEQSRRAAH